MSDVHYKKHVVFRETEDVIFYDISVEESNASDLVVHSGAALSLFTESVMKPDHDLRGCAHNQGCYDELLEIREHVLKYLKTLKEVTHHTNADESDEIETEKLAETKALSKWR